MLGISRGSVYYQPKQVSEEDLVLMRKLDELHLEYPFMGARMLRDQLNRMGFTIGRKRVSTLMKKMGIEANGTSLSHFCMISVPVSNLYHFVSWPCK